MALDFIARAAATSARSDAAQALSRTSTLDLFTNLPARVVDAGVLAVTTGGYAATGMGSGAYSADALATTALAAAHPRFCKQTANGRYFRLVGDYVTVEQAGATGTPGVNDQPAIQAAINYAVAVGIPQVRLTRAAYEVWVPDYTALANAAIPYKSCFYIPGSIELVGLAGGTTLMQKGYLGGDIATQTQTTTDAYVWRGHMMQVGASGAAVVSRLVLRNLIFDGTVDHVAGVTPVDLTHKGFASDFGTLQKIYIYDCEMKRFKGEIFYTGGGGSPSYIFAQNFSVHGSPQCAWNPAAVSEVFAINLTAYDSYQAAETLAGRGSTYIGGMFGYCSSCTFMNVGRLKAGGYPYWYPNPDPALPPPWLTFIGTRFEKAGNITLTSFTRGNIVTVDTGAVIDNKCVSDVDLEVEAWIDNYNNSAAVTISGPSTTTTQIVGAPVGTYYTKPQNVHVKLQVNRTAAAKAAGRQSMGFEFSNLIDTASCLFEIGGEIGVGWRAHAFTTPPAGFVVPLCRVENYLKTQQPYAGWYANPVAGATTVMQMDYNAYSLTPNAAGTATVNMGSTRGYSHGQRVILHHDYNGADRLIKFPANGTGLALREDRILYNQGDLLELEYNVYSGKWEEYRYLTRKQLTFTGSATYDAPSIAAGASATTTVTVTGAALGDFVSAISLGVSSAGLVITGYVSAANTVTVVLYNPTGAAVDLASTLLAAEVRKK